MKRNPGSRKLVAWMFIGTGVISLILWRKGMTEDGKAAGDGWLAPMTISFDFKGREPTPTPLPAHEEIRTRVRALTSRDAGTYGWYVYRPDTNEGYGENQEAVLPAMSIVKVPIMAATFKAVEEGKLNLDDIYVLEARDKRSGSGPIVYYSNGTKIKIRTLLEEMGKKSDNTAAAALTRMLGKENVQETMTDLGMLNSSLEEYTTTPKEAATMLAKLYRGEYINNEHRELMWEFLQDSIYEDRIPAGVPKGTQVIHKVGTDTNVWVDAGIVLGERPFIIAILNDGVKLDEAKQTVPAITRAIWDYESQGR